MRRENVVWLSASATTFSCLCERCLDTAEASFLEAVRGANVRGTVAVDAEIALVHCRAGHDLVLRRVERPPKLARSDARQLQLA